MIQLQIPHAAVTWSTFLGGIAEVFPAQLCVDWRQEHTRRDITRVLHASYDDRRQNEELYWHLYGHGAQTKLGQIYLWRWSSKLDKRCFSALWNGLWPVVKRMPTDACKPKDGTREKSVAHSVIKILNSSQKPFMQMTIFFVCFVRYFVQHACAAEPGGQT